MKMRGKKQGKGNTNKEKKQNNQAQYHTLL